MIYSEYIDALADALLSARRASITLCQVVAAHVEVDLPEGQEMAEADIAYMAGLANAAMRVTSEIEDFMKFKFKLRKQVEQFERIAKLLSAEEN